MVAKIVLAAVALAAVAQPLLAQPCASVNPALGEMEFTCADGTRYIWMKYMGTATWDASQAEAIARGGFLPNQVENTACISQVIGGARYWLGIRDPDPPIANEPARNFEYVAGPRDGVAVNQFDSRWCNGEPNNCCGGENCVVANWISGSSCWNDWGCDGYLPSGAVGTCAMALVEYPTGGCFQEPSYTGSQGVNCVPDAAPEKAAPGASCQADCPEPGYTLSGSATTLTCTVAAGSVEGSWTGAPPTCVPVQCPVDSHATSVHDASGASVTYPTTVTYSCAAGYANPTAGTAARQCQASGALSGSALVCSICPENTFSESGSNQCTPCAAGFVSQPGSAACVPACPLPFEHAWLETLYEPVLDAADSGFLKYAHTKDVLSIIFDNPDGYTFQTASIGSASEATVNHGDPADDVAGNAPAPIGAYSNPKACYTRYEVHSVWGDVEPSCASAIVGNFLEYTCKLAVENKEPLDPIRGEGLERTIISNMPFKVRFPRQVSTSISGLSAFQPPNVLAAIVRQEVIVNVNALADLSAQIKLYTSVQWPFKLTAPQSTATPTDIAPNSFVLDTDCADPAAGDVANPTVNDANACGQIWLLDLDVANGAVSQPCELDGDYAVQFAAACQASWPSDCPLVQDDLGEIQNIFAVNFKIDSEYFCPTVVDEVDVSASLAVFKDFAHTVSASNFILGQTAYFVASVTSSKVTVVKAEVNTISVQPSGAGSVLVYNVANGAACQAADAGASGAVNALAVQDGPCENGEQAEAWFSFLVDASAVPAVPVDGSKDFSVQITIDVEFKNAGGLLEARQVQLLQGGFRSNSQSTAASANFGVAANGNGDETTSAASTAQQWAAASAVAAAAFAQY